MDEARRHILQLVQDGHMSPDQAATVLEMMDRGRMGGPPGWGWPGPGAPPPAGTHAGPPPPPHGHGAPPPGPSGWPPPPPPGWPPPPPPPGWPHGPHAAPPPPPPPPPPGGPPPHGPHGGPPPGPHGGPPPPWPPPPWPPGPPDPHHIAALVRELGPQRARRIARAVAHGGQVVVSVASAGGEVERMHHGGRADLGDAREVAIDHAYGDLVVTAHDDEALTWSLEGETRGGAEPPTVVCDARGDRVALKVRVPELAEGTSSRAALHVQVPSRLAVRCESANGRVSARGLRARTRIRSGNGAVDLSDHEGPFEVTALNGSLAMREVRGDGEVRVENGRVDVEGGRGRWGVRITHGAAHVVGGEGRLRIDVEHGNVHVRGYQGELRIETHVGDVDLVEVGPDVIARCTRTGTIEATTALAPAGRIELRAATGDARLHVAAEPHGRFALQTSSGRIDCSLPLEQLEQTAHAVTGTVGEPRAQVVLEAVLGNVAVDRAPGGSGG